MKAWKMVGWAEGYEVNDKGTKWAATGKQQRRVGPMSFYRARIHGRRRSASYDALCELAGEQAASVFGIWHKLMELAGDLPSELRGWVLSKVNDVTDPDHPERWAPADVEDIARLTRFNPQQIRDALDVLSDPSVFWVAQAEFRGMPGLTTDVHGTPGETPTTDGPGKPGTTMQPSEDNGTKDVKYNTDVKHQGEAGRGVVNSQAGQAPPPPSPDVRGMDAGKFFDHIMERWHRDLDHDGELALLNGLLAMNLNAQGCAAVNRLVHNAQKEQVKNPSAFIRSGIQKLVKQHPKACKQASR